MNQLHLFGGGGGRKESKAEYYRRWRAERIKNRICPNCPSPAVPGKTNCVGCQEKRNNRERERQARLIADRKCRNCGQFPIAESSRRECVSCLKKAAEYNNACRSTNSGRWLSHVATKTRHVANGIQKSSPAHFDWTHDDFCVRFVDWKSGGDARWIDHIIHKSCAVDLNGEKDFEFGALAFDLPNLQLISSRANKSKDYDLDRKVLAKSKKLRSQGLSGAQLFHALWEEFSEAAQAYGDQAD